MNEIDRYTDPTEWHATQAVILIVIFALAICALIYFAMGAP